MGQLRLFLKIKKDIIVTNLRFSLLYAWIWFYRYFLRHEIFCHPIFYEPSGQRAILYTHRETFEQAVLFFHGAYGHPFSLLPLVDRAQMAGFTVYSLHLSYDGKAEVYRALIQKALDHIEREGKKRGSRSVIVVGHSLGAIEGAYLAFVLEDPRVKAVISIAGRLKVVPSQEKPCPDTLKTTLEAVYQGIQKNPALSLYQIVAKNDWNAPLEATCIRPETCYIIAGADHFNILYHFETKQKLTEILKNLKVKKH